MTAAPNTIPIYIGRGSIGSSLLQIATRILLWVAVSSNLYSLAPSSDQNRNLYPKTPGTDEGLEIF